MRFAWKQTERNVNRRIDLLIGFYVAAGPFYVSLAVLHIGQELILGYFGLVAAVGYFGLTLWLNSASDRPLDS